MRTYTQCRLQRGPVTTTAWIPSEFAVVGKWVRIGGRDGWQVVGCGTRLDARYVQGHERDHRTAFPSLT